MVSYSYIKSYYLYYIYIYKHSSHIYPCRFGSDQSLYLRAGSVVDGALVSMTAAAVGDGGAAAVVDAALETVARRCLTNGARAQTNGGGEDEGLCSMKTKELFRSRAPMRLYRGGPCTTGPWLEPVVKGL